MSRPTRKGPVIMAHRHPSFGLVGTRRLSLRKGTPSISRTSQSDARPVHLTMTAKPPRRRAVKILGKQHVVEMRRVTRKVFILMPLDGPGRNAINSSVAHQLAFVM